MIGLAVAQIIWFPYFFCGNNGYINGIYAALHRSSWAIVIISLAYILENLSEDNGSLKIL